MAASPGKRKEVPGELLPWKSHPEQDYQELPALSGAKDFS